MKIPRIFQYLSVRIILCVMLAVIPLNVLAVCSIMNTNEQLLSQTELTVQNSANLYSQQLDILMGQADKYMYTLLSQNADGITLVKQEDDLAYQNAKVWVSYDMQDNLAQNMGLCGYFVYMPALNDMVHGYATGYIDQIAQVKEYLADVVSEQLDKHWKLVTLDGEQYAVRTARYQGVVYGAYLSLETLKKNLHRSIPYEAYTVSIDSALLAKTANNQAVANSLCNTGDFYISVRVEDINVFKNPEFWNRMQLIMVALCLLCAPVLYLSLKKAVIQPLQELTKAHIQLEQGNKNYRIQKNAGALEIRKALSSFNQMADNINSLEMQNMQKDLEKKSLELSNLQLQIRPHFLLNTFNLMYNLASQNEMKNIQELILYLSDYFRYLFKSGRNLELFGKEQALIEGYMHSVQMRYPGRIDIIYQINPDVYMVRVPPLLVHNFIENAVTHGMKPSGDEVMHIMLYGEYDDRTVTFQISDNGIGIEPEVVEQMNGEGWIQSTAGHVGIANSIKRLRYFYGKDATFQVESELGAGTVFTITFPYNLEEE